MRTKSTECLAFPMCFANFVVALEWLMYGYIIEDLFIQVSEYLLFCRKLLFYFGIASKLFSGIIYYDQ